VNEGPITANKSKQVATLRKLNGYQYLLLEIQLHF